MADVSVKMGVSGISQFKQGMNEAQASVKTLDAALKANEKQFERSGNAEEHYAAQTTLLNQKLKQQKQIIENAEKALKQMEDNGVKQSSTAYQNMQRKLIEATTAMMDTQDQLDNLGSKAAGTAEKTDQLASSLGGLNKKVSLEQVIGAVNSITDGLERAAKKAVDLGKELWNQIMDSARRADDTATMSEMYGIDIDTFQRMQKLVANGMDTSVEAILTAQDKLKKGIGSGNKQVMEYMQELGLMYETGKGSMTFITDDAVEMFWQAGKAIMAMGDAYDKEAAAQAMFGRSWKELIPLFNTYDSLEAYNEALAEQTVNSEDTIRDLAALNDAVGKLESSWTTLKDEVLGALAPALTKGADAISGLLDNLTKYLQTEDGQKLLESMGKAVEGLFKDISEIDPQEVVEGFTGVFNSIIEGFKWLETNSGTVVTALESIVIGWGALKLTGGALEIVKLIQGISGLASGGAAAAAGEAGAAAGAAWGSSFASAVMAAAPWLVGLYTLLNPADTASNDWDVLFDEKSGKLTSAGWQDWYNNPENWADTLQEVGDIFGDLARITSDENAINAMARYRMSGDLDTLIREMESLGYIKKLSDEELRKDTGVPETARVDENGYMYDAAGNRIGYQMPQSEGPTYRKNRRTGEMEEIVPPEMLDVGLPESGEVIGLTEEQVAAVERMWDALRTTGDFTDEDWDAYEKAFEGQDELFKMIDDAMDHLYQTNNWDEEALAGLPEDFFTIKAEPELADDAQSSLQELLNGLSLSAVVTLKPSLSFGGIDFFPHANGLPMVPFDGYPALLHKGEQVVTARQVERESRNYSSNLYVESMYMNNGQDAEGLAAAMAAAQRRTSAGFGS